MKTVPAQTPLSALAGIPQYEQHPLAVALAPGKMSDEEYEALKEDIQSRGLIYPVVIHEGMVLDGWHRYQACQDTGTALKSTNYDGTDPAGFVAACTVLRRRLSSLQRALVGARMHLEHDVSQRDACRRFGISNAVLAMVLKALSSKNTMIIRRIENDGDYTRGMLREELTDAGVVHANYGKTGEDPAPTTTAPNSVFALGSANDTVGSGDAEDDDEDLIGGPLPEVGKKPSRKERRAAVTPAQHAQDVFKDIFGDLSEEDQRTFLQMIWPTVRPVAEAAGLPGLAAAKASAKAKLKKVA